MTSRKRVGFVAGAGIGAAAAAALRRRWRPRDEQQPAPTGPAGESFLGHLAEAVRIPTVSFEDPGSIDAAAFDRFHQFLQATYPGVFDRLQPEVVAGHSLLFRWEGVDPDALPILLHTHLDVVPVEEGTEGDWPHPPFGGDQDGGFLWGRGAVDDKGHLVAVFEAVEGLLDGGFEPDTTLYLSVGHDEEVGGGRGAAAIATLLEERGVRLEFVLDEGGAVVHDLLPGARRPVAVLGVAEKGYADLEISASGDGGHASIPPPHTAIGRVAAAVAALEANPMPARVEAQSELLKALSTVVPGWRGLLLRGAGRLGRLVERGLAAGVQTNALIRTTGAVTMIEGGVKANVLPQRARAVVNFRILTGDTVASVLDHVRTVVGEDLAVRVLESGFTGDPAPASDTGAVAYRLIAETIEDVFPGVVVAPWTLMAATDSRHFQHLAENVYRFTPFRMVPEDMSRIHGTGERLRIADAGSAVTFYSRLIRRACGVL